MMTFLLLALVAPRILFDFCTKRVVGVGMSEGSTLETHFAFYYKLIASTRTHRPIMCCKYQRGVCRRRQRSATLEQVQGLVESTQDNHPPGGAHRSYSPLLVANKRGSMPPDAALTPRERKSGSDWTANSLTQRSRALDGTHEDGAKTRKHSSILLNRDVVYEMCPESLQSGHENGDHVCAQIIATIK